MNNNAKTYPKNLKAELLTLCRKDKDLRDKIINTIPQQKFSDLLDAHMTQYNGDEHVVFAGTVLFPDGDTEVVLTTEGGLKTYITRRMRPGGLAKYEPVKTGSKLLRI